MTILATLFENKTWRINRVLAANRIPVLHVENKAKGFCDWPIKYHDGRIAWDYPERIPSYIREVTTRII